MPAVINANAIQKLYLTDGERWEAVVHRERNADDAFVYSVKTTRIYCRPTCPARRAHRDNVAFHPTSKAAEQAGFRACKRCKPGDFSPRGEHLALVARACNLMIDAPEPLSLGALAKCVGMSPWHFHRVFKSLTGLTPKAYATAHRAKRMQEELTRRGTVTAAIYNSGFNSNGRFYAESNQRLGMKPSKFRAGGNGARIRFAVGECSLGSILVAASDLGICSIALGNEPDTLLKQLQDRFPNAELIGGDKQFERMVAQVIAFVENPAVGLELPLHVQGTAFQQRVWKALCEIPCGTTCSYSELARTLGQSKAARAVAGACAANTLAVAIPCHRVVHIDGSLSGYRWGVDRKERLLAIERAGI
jgi:AraC family transcriptional regulator, regulatory protein of adaptative response / methylated-DNA-[protein]-cysteine methyltransferase